MIGDIFHACNLDWIFMGLHGWVFIARPVLICAVGAMKVVVWVSVLCIRGNGVILGIGVVVD